MSKAIFLTSEKERITEAVAALEKESSGELVLYYAKKSDSYKGAAWKLASIVGISFALIAIILSYLWLLPPFFTPIVTAITIAVSIITSYVLALLLPAIRVTITNDTVVDHSVLTKAHDMFLKEQVFDTVDRTGILIYISALERQVVVLGDSGINQKITQDDWVQVVKLIVDGIISKQMTDGIVNAVKACKLLLLENGFKIKPGDTNELPDAIRIEE